MATTHDSQDFGENVDKAYWSEIQTRKISVINDSFNTCTLVPITGGGDTLYHVPFFYHCPGDRDVSRGFEGFKQWDHVLVLVEKTSESDSSPSYSVVGHKDPEKLAACPKVYLFIHYYENSGYPSFTITPYGHGYVWDCYANRLADGKEFGPKVGLPSATIIWPVDSGTIRDWANTYGTFPDTHNICQDDEPLSYQEKKFPVWRSPISGEYTAISDANDYGILTTDDPPVGITYVSIEGFDGQGVGVGATGVNVQNFPAKMDVLSKNPDEYIFDGWASMANSPTLNSTFKVPNTIGQQGIPRKHKYYHKDYYDIYTRTEQIHKYYFNMWIGEDSSELENCIELYWYYDVTQSSGLAIRCRAWGVTAVSDYGWKYCNWWYYRHKSTGVVKHDEYRKRDICSSTYGYGGNSSKDFGYFYKRYMYQVSIMTTLFAEQLAPFYPDDPPVPQFRFTIHASSNVFDDLAFYHNPREQSRNSKFEEILTSTFQSAVDAGRGDKGSFQRYLVLI